MIHRQDTARKSYACTSLPRYTTQISVSSNKQITRNIQRSISTLVIDETYLLITITWYNQLDSLVSISTAKLWKLVVGLEDALDVQSGRCLGVEIRRVLIKSVYRYIVPQIVKGLWRFQTESLDFGSLPEWLAYSMNIIGLFTQETAATTGQ